MPDWALVPVASGVRAYYLPDMREIAFRKMHGLGNDFVVIDARDDGVDLSPELIQKLADRHRGVGFDQLVRIEPSQSADVRLSFFNADGSEAGACGNATRCVGRLLLLEGDRAELVLETRGGNLAARRRPDGLVTVAMAVPGLEWRDIPLAKPCDTLAVPLDLELPPPVAVSMGNPHAVFFLPDLDGGDVVAAGKAVQAQAMFPEGVNAGFAQVLRPGVIRLRVYERGVGLTQACGSGACAAMVAARRRGLVGDSATIIMDGGSLDLAWPGEGPVLMTGPTSLVFTGTLDADQLMLG